MKSLIEMSAVWWTLNIPTFTHIWQENWTFIFSLYVHNARTILEMIILWTNQIPYPLKWSLPLYFPPQKVMGNPDAPPAKSLIIKSTFCGSLPPFGLVQSTVFRIMWPANTHVFTLQLFWWYFRSERHWNTCTFIFNNDAGVHFRMYTVHQDHKSQVFANLIKTKRQWTITVLFISL